MPDNNHPMDLNPHTRLLIDLFRVEGGIETHTEVLSNDLTNGRRVKRAKVTQIVANEDERTEAKAIATKARDALRARSTHTLIGYLADADRVPEIDTEIQAVKEMAHAFNARARTCQVEISYLVIEISLALGPPAARALADHVRKELMLLRDALIEGRLENGENNVRTILHRTKNLHALAVGVQADSIRFAIEEAKEARKRVKEAMKATGETPESVGRYLDLGMLESAIATFTYQDHEAGNALGVGIAT